MYALYIITRLTERDIKLRITSPIKARILSIATFHRKAISLSPRWPHLSRRYTYIALLIMSSRMMGKI